MRMKCALIQSPGHAAISILAAAVLLVTLPPKAEAKNTDTAALERRISELNRQLDQAKAELATAKAANKAVVKSETTAENGKVATIEQESPVTKEPITSKIKFGPVTIGGAVRANYVYGDYSNTGSAPSRGGNGGNFELDTFRINASLEYQHLLGKLEYRWYNGYNFLHTGWLGYDFEDAGEVQVGVTRVPFGPGPYGISQSWFFDQHFYVGLADDMDFGIKYLTRRGNWDLAFAYFYSSEGAWNGASEDSARYGYDAVKWQSALDTDGNVVSAPTNGYEERNQFNLRAIYRFNDIVIPTNLGVSLQYGQLKGERTDDGSHWAASAHMVNTFGNFKLATQLTRYEFDIDADNPLGTDELIPMGAFDFAWPVAASAWIPAVSLSYNITTSQIPWLDSVTPYLEYSSIIKESGDFNDSQLFILGAAWASGGWYIYTDLAWSNGNLFIGNQGDNYSNIFDGVGDVGVDGNDRWNYRFNINFGYYF